MEGMGGRYAERTWGEHCYCMFAHLFSFLGVEEQSAVVNDKIRLLLDLYVHFKQLCPDP